MPKPISKNPFIKAAYQAASSIQRSHNKYLKLSPAARTIIWSAMACFAFMGVQAERNEGLVNDVIFVPIIEEAGRGVIHFGIEKAQKAWNDHQKTKMDETSVRNRVLASSAIFSLMHLPLDPMEHFWNLGRGCGYLTEKTGSLFAPVLLHMKHNFIAGTFLRSYIPKGIFYPPFFYLLGKKMFPIPDFITNKISSWVSPFFAKKTAAASKSH